MHQRGELAYDVNIQINPFLLFDLLFIKKEPSWHVFTPTFNVCNFITCCFNQSCNDIIYTVLQPPNLTYKWIRTDFIWISKVSAFSRRFSNEYYKLLYGMSKPYKQLDISWIIFLSHILWYLTIYYYVNK